jgi:hypothetical protein
MNYRVLPKLTVQIKHQRMAFAERAQNNEVSFNNSDETHFHFGGVVNKQNVRYWASENPRVIHEKCIMHRELTVWVAISSHGLLRPIFFEETVNSERYLSMLGNTFVPHLLVTGSSLQTQWSMQDGARPHTANIVSDFLHDNFDSRIISNRFPDRFACGQNWPPNSPDLNPCDYFLWGFLKEKIFPKKPQTIMELRALIIQTCNEITEDMCRRVINIIVRVEEVARRKGDHIEHLIHRG